MRNDIPYTLVSVCSTVTLTVLWLWRIKTGASKSVRSPIVPAPNDGVEQRWSSSKAKNANSHHNLKDMAQSNSICWLSAWDKRKPDVYSARALCTMLSCSSVRPRAGSPEVRDTEDVGRWTIGSDAQTYMGTLSEGQTLILHFIFLSPGCCSYSVLFLLYFFYIFFQFLSYYPPNVFLLFLPWSFFLHLFCS